MSHPVNRATGALAFGIALALASTAAAQEVPTRPDAKVDRIGTTFSQHELKARGYDWRQALDAADELGLNFLRLGVYWSDVEPKEGVYDFAELDELLERVAKKGYQVLLTVGMKAPRYPEYSIPQWAEPRLGAVEKLEESLGMPVVNQDVGIEISKDPELRRRVLDYVRTTVRHVRALPAARAIVAWQVENEPMDKAGPKRRWIGADLVQEEAKAIRDADPGRKLLVNCWCEDQRIASAPWTDGDYDVRNALDIADLLGLDVYMRVPEAPGDQLDEDNRVENLPRKDLAEARARGKDAWIIESQAEGWGSYQPTPADMRWLVGKHLEQGYRTITLWGFESWYDAKVKHGDATFWNAVRDLASDLLGSTKRLEPASGPIAPLPPLGGDEGPEGFLAGAVDAIAQALGIPADDVRRAEREVRAVLEGLGRPFGL